MRIAVFGATGNIGRRIVQEALERGHEVTAVVREGSSFSVAHPKLKRAVGDVLDAGSIARAAEGHDVLVSAYGPPQGREAILVEATRALVEGARRARVGRLVMVGGAGSLEVAPGLQLVDAPSFPDAYKPIALAHRDALEVLRASDIDWTSLSPAALIGPGERVGKFRLGTDQLIADEQGQSRISYDDYAIALVDEVEKGNHRRRRFTVAY